MGGEGWKETSISLERERYKEPRVTILALNKCTHHVGPTGVLYPNTVQRVPPVV